MKSRRRRYLESKPISIPSIFWGCVALLTVIIQFALLFYDAFKVEELPRYVGGSGVIFTFIAIVALIQSIKHYRDENFREGNRRFGLVSSLVAVLLWATLYFIGIYVG